MGPSREFHTSSTSSTVLPTLHLVFLAYFLIPFLHSFILWSFSSYLSYPLPLFPHSSLCTSPPFHFNYAPSIIFYSLLFLLYSLPSLRSFLPHSPSFIHLSIGSFSMYLIAFFPHSYRSFSSSFCYPLFFFVFTSFLFSLITPLFLLSFAN